MAVPLTTDMQKQIANLYISILGRNPDPVGFGYWCDVYANANGTQAALDAIASGFGKSPEFTGIYSGQTPAAAVALMYNNILGRTQDTTGAAYWTGIAQNYITSGKTVGDAYALTANAMITAAAANTGTADATLIASKQSTAVTAGTSTPVTTYTLTTSSPETITATGSNNVINGTQATFQASDVITGNANGTNKLVLVDTGTAAWTLPAATVSGVQTISLQNLNGIQAVTETGTVTFSAIKTGEYLTIAGVTVVATADLTAAQVATAFTTGTQAGASVRGAISGWTVAANSNATQAVYTSSTAGNVADLITTVSGTAQAGQPQLTTLTVTSGGNAGANFTISFTYNGTTVTTATLLTTSTATQRAQAVADAINGYAGTVIARNDAGVITISSPTTVSLAGFASTSTNSTFAYALAPASNVIAYTTTSGAAASTFKVVYNGVEISASIPASSTVSASATLVADAINNYVGSKVAVANGVAGQVAISVPSVIGTLTQDGTTTAANTATGSTSGLIAATPVSVVEVQGVAGGGQTDTIDATKFVGATNFTLDQSPNQNNITGLASTQSVTINGNGSVANGITNATWGASVAAVTLNVNGGTKSGGLTTLTAADNTLATVTVNSTGAANTLNGLTLAGSNAIKTLNINATTNLTTGAIGGLAAGSTVTISGAAASVNVGSVTNATTINAAALAGGVTMTINDLALAFTGGAGNDVVTTLTGTQTGVINAGAGTADKLIVVAGTSLAATPASKFVGFEILQNNQAANLDISNVAGITSVVLNNATAGVIGLNATQAGAVSAIQSITSATIALANASGASDVLSLTGTNATAATATNFASLTVNGIETINYTNNATAASTLSFVGASTGITTINVAGTKGVTLDLDVNGAAGGAATTATVISAANLTAQATGTNTFTLQDGNGSNALTPGLVVTGSAGDDVFSFGPTVAAADTIASGLVTINGGSGNDNLTVASGQLYTAGSGALAFNGGADTGSTGGDTLTIRSTGGNWTVNDLTWKNISGVENLVFSQAATEALSLTTGANFNAAFANGVTITNAADTTSAATTANFNAATFSVKYTHTGTTGVQTITGGSAADTLTITSAAAATGANTVVISGGAGNDTISVTDASSISVGGSISITGGTGKDAITQSGVSVTTGGVTHVIDVVNLGDSTVGNADTITGFYVGVAANARLADTIDFAGSAIKPAAAIATTTVNGYTALTLTYSIDTAGKLVFAGTAAATVTAAMVETIWTQQISAQLNNLETIVWADANANDVQNGNSLVFNHNVGGDSEVILVGVQAVAVGAAATTANIVGIA